MARAVASLNTLAEYLLPLVKVGGIALVYKSAKLEEELACAQKAIKVLGGRVEDIKSFVLEGEIDRKILIICKIAHTPPSYPRGQNKPKMHPIS